LTGNLATLTNVQIICEVGVTLTLRNVIINNIGNSGVCPLTSTPGILGMKTIIRGLALNPQAKWGIKAPFEVPDESFMALELEDGSLEGITGIVVYSKEFFE